MLVGVAIIPTAPLLVPGVSATLPDGVAEVQAAVSAALDRLPSADVAVLLAAADPGVVDPGVVGPGLADPKVVGPGVYEAAEASLAGFGSPGLAVTYPVADPGWLSGTPRRHGPLPSGLAVLALLFGDQVPVLPLAVDAEAPAAILTAQGVGIASGFEARRALVLAAGDLSAGLDERSPRHRIEGARAWDEQAVAAVDGDQPEQLATLGPEEARRVAALGWAPMVVAQAACVATEISLGVRHYSAPRGVGYLVAHA